ncbi:unnamed protein product [Ambrosiozyma monospora]|uniref:ATP-dependent RNA helicase n=1 Tax=Ambrosiozyma monospora TaxID=43982 RepID=A0A9W7DE97_AMBMO|nr:unnamed protein product [Ambrosiozyma monospora]
MLLRNLRIFRSSGVISTLPITATKDYIHLRQFHTSKHLLKRSRDNKLSKKAQQEENRLIDKLLEDTDADDEIRPPSIDIREKKKQLALEKGLMKAKMTRELNEQVRENMGVIRGYDKLLKTDPLQRVKVNLDDTKDIQKFSDFFVHCGPLLRTFKNHLGSDLPTDFQRKIFTLSTGQLSTIAKGDSGSGRTMALIMMAMCLNRHRARGPGVSTLIIVKSNDLVLKYQQIITKVYQDLVNLMKTIPIPREQRLSFENIDEEETILKYKNINEMAQFLYRSDATTELKQQEIIAENPLPHILVSTPHRLLDLLSTRGMNFLKINNVQQILVDDFDTMIDPETYLDSDKTAPVVLLLDYVLKLQDYNRKHRDPHPMICFTVSSSCNNSLIEQIKEEKQWFDWKKFVPIGSFESPGSLPIHKSVPDNVSLGSVLVLPVIDETVSENVDNKKKTRKSKKKSKGKNNFKVELYDMTPFEYGSDMRTWIDKSYRTTEGHDAYYFKHRNKRLNAARKVKDIGFEILISGFIELHKRKELGLKQEKLLFVHPDSVNGTQVRDFLKKTKRKGKVFNFSDGDESFFVDDQNKNDFLIINSSALPSLTFNGLKTIVVLGNETIKNMSNFITIAGRIRNDKKGLISEDRFPELLDVSENGQRSLASSTTKNSNNSDSDKGRIFLINSLFEFDHYDRNYLERLFIRGGLVDQFSPCGVLEPGFDQDAYNSTFVPDYTFQYFNDGHEFQLDEE